MKRSILAAAVAIVLAQGLWPSTPSVLAKAPGGEATITSHSPQAVQAFRIGRDLLENVRTAESIAHFRRAIELDPGFALAHAYLGSVLTPVSEGLKELEQAQFLARQLPQPERLEIQAMLADARGEEQKARSLWVQLSRAAPNDWHAQFAYGRLLFNERRWGQAAIALKRATALNPKSGEAYNLLGYSWLNQDKYDQAIVAFRKYCELRPDEPNPFDSLAEAQMAADHLEDAEASFRKALEISPLFYTAWSGIGQTRFLRDDWAGGREALASARSAASRTIEKLGVDYTLAWSQLAAGQPEQALRTIDELEAQARTESLHAVYVYAPLVRARMLLDTGRPELALEQVALSLERSRVEELPGATLNTVRRDALTTRVEAQARLKRVQAATNTLAMLETEAWKAPANPYVQSQIQCARGEVALARGDARAAVAAFARCIDQDTRALWRLSVAQAKAGDARGATQTRDQVLRAHHRDDEYLVLHTQLGSGRLLSALPY